MSTKSHVSLEQKVCPVCGITHSHNCGVLLDKRLHNSMERHTVTGYGLCEEHDRLNQEGYIMLVAAKNPADKATMQVGKAERTGEIAAIKREVFMQLFNVPAAQAQLPMVYVEPEVIEHLRQLMEADQAD